MGHRPGTGDRLGDMLQLEDCDGVLGAEERTGKRGRGRECRISWAGEAVGMIQGYWHFSNNGASGAFLILLGFRETKCVR